MSKIDWVIIIQIVLVCVCIAAATYVEGRNGN